MPTQHIIAAAIHYVSSDLPYYEHDEKTPLVPSRGSGDSRYGATRDLLNKGLLVQAGNEPRIWYNATDGLRLYVKALTEVPLPKQIWTILGGT